MHQIEHFELAKNDAICLKLHAGCLVRVSHGRLWLTQPGHAQDVWLQAGESWTQAATGPVWLSAEPSAQFQLAHALLPGSSASRFPRLMAWHGLRALLTWRHLQIVRPSAWDAR